MPRGDVMYSELRQPPVIGRIGLIQERGMKLRAVANPFRLWQHVLTPLGDFLFGILRTLEWDCTFDQDKGITFIQEALAHKRHLYAFDLSNATDMFPLSEQLVVVRDLVTQLKANVGIPSLLSTDPDVTVDDLDKSLDLLRDLSRGRWSCEGLARYNGGDPFLSWKTGQPLGLYPSFALFALTHGILLRNLEKGVGTQGSFRVLGDDVIISDARVAALYKETITSLGCLISDKKSLVSSSMGEFAGRLVTIDGIIPVVKWQGFSLNNPLGTVGVLGVRGLGFVPSRYRKGVRRLMSLPKPFGLELNPDGIPLESRVDPVLEKLFVARGEREVLTDYILSPRDRKDHETAWWKSVLVGADGRCRLDSHQRKTLPYPSDQDGDVDLVKIEHWNAYIRTLKPWDEPKLQKPYSPARLVNRTSKWSLKGLGSSFFFKILRLIRKSKV
jgi:hypothetical protein